MRESPASRDFPFPAWSCPESILHAKTSGSTNHAKSLRPEESLSFSKRAHQPLSLSSSADAVQCGKVAGRAILLLRALSLGAPAARRDCSRSAGTCGPPARLQRRRTLERAGGARLRRRSFRASTTNSPEHLRGWLRTLSAHPNHRSASQAFPGGPVQHQTNDNCWAPEDGSVL
jgi:hypothetical protein